MKLILSGPTGFIGSSILSHALQNPNITSLIALSRKPLEISHPKLSVNLIEDFLVYTPEVLRLLEGAEGCIWFVHPTYLPTQFQKFENDGHANVYNNRTIGAKALTDAEVTQRVTVDYTMAAARAFSKIKLEEGKRFRFVFTSGKMSVADRGERLWLFKEARYISVRTPSLFSNITPQLKFIL